MPSSKGPKTWRSKAREEPKTNAPSSSADPDGIADALTMAAMQGNVEAVKALLEGGISADCHDAIGVAPLHWAAFCGHGEVTGLLLGARADVTVRDQEGRTPLHVAAYESHMDVIKRLLRAGADMMAPDKSARHALPCPHTLLFLRSHPLSPILSAKNNNSGLDAAALRRLEWRGDCLQVPRRRGRRPAPQGQRGQVGDGLGQALWPHKHYFHPGRRAGAERATRAQGAGDRLRVA